LRIIPLEEVVVLVEVNPSQQVIRVIEVVEEVKENQRVLAKPEIQRVFPLHWGAQFHRELLKAH